MRYHFWQFLINQEGQPINDAEISIYLAGTTTPARIYTGEITSNVVNVAPQVLTNANGYFEFWIGDEEESLGYTRGTKFKIAWNRAGIASGIVDNVDVFQTMEGVNESDPDSVYKNKLISNALAYKFNSHSEHNVLDDGFPIHGLMMVDTTSNDNVYNRVISNRLGYQWESHKNYIFESLSPSELENSAHDLQPVNVMSNDGIYNKLISNANGYEWENHKIYTFTSESESLSGTGAHGLEPVNFQTIEEDHGVYKRIVSNKIIYDIYNSTLTYSITGGWTDEGGGVYSYNIIHNMNCDFPSVTCWNINTRKIYTPLEVESIDENTLKITSDSNTLQLVTKIFSNMEYRS